MKSDLIQHLSASGLMPQEEMLAVHQRESKLFIGIPKETAFQEHRVAIVPDSVALLISHGHRVLIESKAGEKSNFHDKDYSDAGAEICYDTKEVYQADMIMKVAPPTIEEIALFDENRRQILFSALQLTVQPRESIAKLMQKKVTAIAYDFIQDREGIFPIVRSMSEIAGTTSILIAAEYLSNTNGGHGTMLGGIAGVKPSEVVIIGAGAVGEFAAKTAMGLGAVVKVFDNEIYRLRRIMNQLGQRVYTSIIHPKVLGNAIQNADVVIGALRPKNGQTPCVVTDEMVAAMKYGSVIIDVSIDHGGCFETSRVSSHDNPIYKKYGVLHYAVPNIASRVSRTASYALSNVFTPLIMDMGKDGGIDKTILNNAGIRNGVYIYKGILTNQVLGESFSLPYKNINLLLAAL